MVRGERRRLSEGRGERWRFGEGRRGGREADMVRGDGLAEERGREERPTW